MNITWVRSCLRVLAFVFLLGFYHLQVSWIYLRVNVLPSFVLPFILRGHVVLCLGMFLCGAVLAATCVARVGSVVVASCGHAAGSDECLH